ncbi:hypothetical protein EVAR_21926_1 [Eumeta japonica]|uniref:Uncharacterized protein n=1 Tax=Eumeta variegata TaxID=151549 RepID=A0A4C1XJ74_EUMVA|nr:hypothetical protein EVAR_21926_1 [Eumeta japonica]
MNSGGGCAPARDLAPGPVLEQRARRLWRFGVYLFRRFHKWLPFLERASGQFIDFLGQRSAGDGSYGAGATGDMCLERPPRRLPYAPK